MDTFMFLQEAIYIIKKITEVTGLIWHLQQMTVLQIIEDAQPHYSEMQIIHYMLLMCVFAFEMST
jgi:hypothetical protein